MMERLEDRILFDGDPTGALPDADSIQPEMVEQELTETTAQTLGQRELVVVDPSVEDSDLLLEELLANRPQTDFEVRFLSREIDGVQQLTEMLGEAGTEVYSAVHVLTHGSEGSLVMGNAVLNEATPW